MKTRDKIARTITHPLSIIIIISLCLSLSILYNNVGTLFGFTVAFFTLWAKRWDWSFFGIKRNPFSKTFLKSICYTVLILIVNDVLLQPVIEFYFGSTDLSTFYGIKGNWINYIAFVVIMWFVAAFGEEFLFRGYMLKRLAHTFGDSNLSWFIAILLSSIVFGFAHMYQGYSGVFTTGFVAIFFHNRKNLWVGVLTHGIYNMVGITLIFADKERVITEWALENIFTFLK